MSQVVQYEVSLKDLLTPKLREMESQAGKAETAIHGIGEAGHRLTHMLEGLGISFAIFKGFEFVESGVEAFHHLHEAEAQVQAGLLSTKSIAGLTFEELEKGAIGLASQFKYSRAEITDMQSVLLTFPGVTKATFGEAEQSVVDLSTKLHHGLQETVIQVGKALQDPINGITALRRVGVNFNDSQKETIAHLVKTGQAAKAQALILHELATEVAGSAKAAADADPLFKYNKLMGSIKMSVGEAATNLLHYLTPALEYVAQTIKDGITWIREHQAVLRGAAIVAGVAGSAFVVLKGIVIGMSVAAKVATFWNGLMSMGVGVLGGSAGTASGLMIFFRGAIEGVNVAMRANPIGFIVSALALLTTGVIYAYNKFAVFRAVLFGVWGVIKEFGKIVSDVFQSIYHVIHGVFTFNPKEITSGFSGAADAMLNAGKRMATSYKEGFDEGMADFNKDQAGEKKEHPLIPTVGKTKPGLDVVGGATPDKTSAPKNTGTKNVKIDIKINNLVNGFTINTTTLKEGTDKLRDHVTQVLLSAVNDSQIVGAE